MTQRVVDRPLSIEDVPVVLECANNGSMTKEERAGDLPPIERSMRTAGDVACPLEIERVLPGV